MKNAAYKKKNSVTSEQKIKDLNEQRFQLMQQHEQLLKRKAE